MRKPHERNILAKIAATLYHTPESASAETVEVLAAVLRCKEVAEEQFRLSAALLRSVITTGAGRNACESLIAIVREKGRSPKIYGAAIESLQYAVAWAPERLDVQSVLGLLALDHLDGYRLTLAQTVVEPLLCYQGAALTVATFERFRECCGADSFFRYFCYFIAERQDFSAAVREKAWASLPGRFALWDEGRRILGVGARRVLVVQNIQDGQGDEIVRCVPLIQALLDSNLELEVTLITSRGYLFRHSRITVVRIENRTAVTECLGGMFDAVVDFFDPGVREVNRDRELEPLIQAYIDKSRPRLVMSSRKGYNHFLFQRFDVNGRAFATELALDQQRIENTYETTYRVIAELRLPLRCGEGQPISEPVLIGVPSQDAVAAWTALTERNSARRPVAICNPFGGLERLKGFVKWNIGSLVGEIRRLLGEGYYVVLFPNGTPWGTTALLQQVVDGLDANEQPRVAIAADPAGGDASHADRMMVNFIHFIERADLIESVEGWAIHVAYCLGKPYRILMLPYSHPASWHPFLQTSNQRIASGNGDTSPMDDSPPLPRQPRKFALLSLLRAIGHTGDAGELPFLRRALVSEDRDVRLAACLSLRTFRGELNARDWVRLLDDSWFRIRAVAAGALLESTDASLAGLALHRDHLKVYGKIAEESRKWGDILPLREVARPAIEAGLDDDDPVIRRECLQMMRLLDLARRKPSRRTGIRDRLARFLRRPAQPALVEKNVSAGAKILILTPVKDAAGCIGRFCRRLTELSYPHELISIGFLEGDSEDSSFAWLQQQLPVLRESFRRASLWKKDFGFRIPAGTHRGAEGIQAERRKILARSRNHLLLRALDDEEWVLWIDVDVIEYPRDIIERLLAAGKDVVQPHCVLEYGGRTFDLNAWRDQGRVHLDDLRTEGDLVELHAVGGTMLLVRADLHRDGLVFPPAPYGVANPLVRSGTGEVETEGLGIMARDMGHTCWGMPNLEVRHRRW